MGSSCGANRGNGDDICSHRVRSRCQSLPAIEEAYKNSTPVTFRQEPYLNGDEA